MVATHSPRERLPPQRLLFRRSPNAVICDPITGQIRLSLAGDIVCWFTHTDYIGESFAETRGDGVTQ
jgi:hypothetical protein